MTRQRIRRARSILFWSLAGFATLQLALAVSIEFWLPQVRDPYYGYRVNLLRQRTVEATPPPFTVVVLGSSRTRQGLLGKSLEQPLAQATGRPAVVFNFGQNSAGPMTELLNLKRLLADGIRPDLLLVEVMPPFLGVQQAFEEAGELRLPTHRLRFADLPLVEHYGEPLRTNVYREWWLAALFPWHSHRLKIFNCVWPLPRSHAQYEGLDSLDDSCSLHGSPAQMRHKLEPHVLQAALEYARKEYCERLANFRLGGPNCEALCELLTLCRELNIRTALVLMPEGDLFRSWYPPSVWNAIQNHLDAISRTYQTPMINCRNWISSEDFLDSHHLHVKGADEFTRRLGQEVIPLLLHDESIDRYTDGLTGGLAGNEGNALR
jgi:hypothetical protein